MFFQVRFSIASVIDLLLHLICFKLRSKLLLLTVGISPTFAIDFVCKKGLFKAQIINCLEVKESVLFY